MDKERRSKVLVVDDIISNIEFVSEVLELENLEVLTAKTGREAIRKCTEFNPNLILLDISMPEMDGFEVIREIKNNPAIKETPVIFLTARIQKEDIIKGFEYGAVDYIIKPFNFNELISRVKTHLDLRHKTELLKTINYDLEKEVELRTGELKQAYEDLKRANNELREANQKLAWIDNVKTEFVLHINHELRTPLNGIKGYVDLLNETVTGESAVSHVKSIDTLTNRLIKVAELSLLFTELKTRQQEIELSPVDLNQTLNEAIHGSDFGNKNIEVEIENPYRKLFVIAEHKLLLTCLSIVIDNAIKYSPRDSSINIKIKKSEKNIEFTLTDRGTGFSDKALEQLFNFFAADNLHHHTNGFGIGLATAKIILDVIGGEISVSNREPHGAIVKMVFPNYAD